MKKLFVVIGLIMVSSVNVFAAQPRMSIEQAQDVFMEATMVPRSAASGAQVEAVQEAKEVLGAGAKNHRCCKDMGPYDVCQSKSDKWCNTVHDQCSIGSDGC